MGKDFSNYLIRSTGYFLILSLILGLTGCSKGIIRTENDSIKEWKCDEDADQAMIRGEYKTSIRLHERLLIAEPSNGLASYHLGYAYGLAEDHDNEIFYYEKALASGYRTDGIFFNLGMAYGEAGRIKDSIDAFKRGINRDANNPDIHFGLAVAYQKDSLYDLAEVEFLRTIEIDPYNLDARFYLGLQYFERGEKVKAREQAEKIMEIDRDSAFAREIFERIKEK